MTVTYFVFWSIGAGIVARQKNTKWGDRFLLRLSRDLMSEFPDMKGFSKRNLELVRQWYLFYSQIAKQPVSQLPPAQITQIPWGHNIAMIQKIGDRYLFLPKSRLEDNREKVL